MPSQARALLGALLAPVSRLRHQRRLGRPTAYRDVPVEVEAPDTLTRDDVLDLLARAGGDPLPST